MTDLTTPPDSATMAHVDLMLCVDGSYLCASWCEGGITSIRGNFCPKCAWDDAFITLTKYAGSVPFRGFDLFCVEVFDKVGLRLV